MCDFIVLYYAANLSVFANTNDNLELQNEL